MLVVGMLIVTSATAREIWADSRDPLRRRCEYSVQMPARKAGLLFDYGGLNPFALQHEGNKEGLAAAVLVSGETRQTISPIHQFFNIEFQEIILWY